MQGTRQLIAELDAALDRIHRETIVALLGCAVLAFAYPRIGLLEFVEFAYTLDWIIASVGIGVLVGLWARR